MKSFQKSVIMAFKQRIVNLCMLAYFSLFFVLSVEVSSKNFFEQCIQIVVSNSLDPDQARQNAGPDLDPNGLTL